MPMRIGRIILTFLVALSLSMAPLAGAFAVPSQDEPAVSEVIVTAGHDCCDHESMPTSPMPTECQASAGCLAKCFGLYGLELSGPTLAPPVGGPKSYFASDPIDARTASPPFRPPRV